MRPDTRRLCRLGLLCLTILLSINTTASAVSADLANKCRQLATKAYPPKSVGSKSGNAGAERRYFQECVSKGGAMQGDDAKAKSEPHSQ